MWSGRSSFTSLVVGVFVVYVVHTCWVMYGIVYTRPCASDGNCIQPYLARKPKLQLSVYTTTRSNLGAENNVDLVLNVEDFDVESKFERTVNVSVPKKTRNNGTLYAYIFLHHAGVLPWHDGKQVHLVSPLTTYMVPKPEEVNLLTGESSMQQIEAEKKPPSALEEPVSHWRPRLALNVMVDDFVFDGASLPADVRRYMKMVQLGKAVHYLPILFIDQLSSRVKDLMVINRSTTELPLTVSYDRISLGRLRFWIHMQDAVFSLQQFGFSEKDADEVKGIFVDTNLYFLALTFFVAAFHLLFDFLAFKNDISFWKKKKSMMGMSTKAVLWRGFSTVVIFLFLLDEQTSLLVLVPAGIGAAIEFGTYSESERRTEEYDTQAMKYLSYLLYPLCIGGAVYSLLNIKYKSWYSWLINSFVNGVYAFGFLFMLPQLFVNYKVRPRPPPPPGRALPPAEPSLPRPLTCHVSSPDEVGGTPALESLHLQGQCPAHRCWWGWSLPVTAGGGHAPWGGGGVPLNRSPWWDLRDSGSLTVTAAQDLFLSQKPCSFSGTRMRTHAPSCPQGPGPHGRALRCSHPLVGVGGVKMRFPVLWGKTSGSEKEPRPRPGTARRAQGSARGRPGVQSPSPRAPFLWSVVTGTPLSSDQRPRKPDGQCFQPLRPAWQAFNTFIDDVFAFIITMPTSHRLACFRDDVVFLVYLYQRW
uniref:Lipid scramblase CLPTM1L n=1 Tax=Suricata suricatta TaxID=37032 RepID=A0A673SML1_SURSU